MGSAHHVAVSVGRNYSHRPRLRRLEERVRPWLDPRLPRPFTRWWRVALYVDAKPVVGGRVPNTLECWLGLDMKGTIAEVACYSQPLGEQEVRAAFKEGGGR